MGRWIASVVVCAACGRVGFDASTIAGGDAEIDGSGLGGGSSLRLGASGQQSYVQLGNPNALHLDTFTIEMWLQRLGTGAVSGSGNPPGALENVVPLLTKGRGEAEDPPVDINFFVALDPAAGFALAADFEESQTGPDPSRNHKVIGATPLEIGRWHHVAVAYDGRTWRLYFDGQLDVQLDLGAALPIAASSMVDAVIGGASNSNGDVKGYFDGFIDELRIWKTARSTSEIAAGRPRAIATDPGLVARWSFDEGVAATIVDSHGGLVGTVTPATSAEWTAGAPID